LQGVPMFDCLAVGFHLVDVDAGDPRILRVVIEEIQKFYVRPYVVADGDNAVDDDAGSSAFPRDLGEESLARSNRHRLIVDHRHDAGGHFRPNSSSRRLISFDVKAYQSAN
jgi:hypothetical protein